MTDNQEVNKQGPKPLVCSIDGTLRTATFDREELRRFVTEASASSFAVQDAAGNMVGIAHTSLIRELFSEQEVGRFPTAVLDFLGDRHPLSLSE